MTKKHFEMIAGRINAVLRASATMEEEYGAIMLVARGMADDFKAENPRFNRQQFLTACTKGTGVDPE